MSRPAFLEAYPHPFLVEVSRLTQQDEPGVKYFTATDSGSGNATCVEASEALVYPVLKRKNNRFEGLVTVGRTETNDIVLFSTKISKVHAYFQRQGSGWTLADQGSRNGTFIEKRRLTQGEPQRVHDGEQVRLGVDFVAKFLTPASLGALLG